MKTSRVLTLAALVALAAAPALSQTRPRGGPAGKPAAEPAGPPPIFPCRTAEEVCFMVVGVGSQAAILYTNAAGAEPEPVPVDVTGPDGQKIDMSKNAGRVMMVTGAFDAKAGITKAEVVEVASPLASLAVKAQLAGGGDEPGGRKGGPPPRRR